MLSSEGLDLFREFLRTEFSEENIEFWIACEDYKNVHSNKLNTEAQRIYTDFIAVQAPHEVSGMHVCMHACGRACGHAFKMSSCCNHQNIDTIL